jgi:hypothetical protein
VTTSQWPLPLFSHHTLLPATTRPRTPRESVALSRHPYMTLTSRNTYGRRTVRRLWHLETNARLLESKRCLERLLCELWQTDRSITPSKHEQTDVATLCSLTYQYSLITYQPIPQYLLYVPLNRESTGIAHYTSIIRYGPISVLSAQNRGVSTWDSTEPPIGAVGRRQ